jgi:hypothetical protein
MSRFVCGTLGFVCCASWSSGVASVNGGVASGLGGGMTLSVIRLSASALGMDEGGCMLEA